MQQYTSFLVQNPTTYHMLLLLRSATSFNVKIVAWQETKCNTALP
jgi:hypothetical protein